MIALWVDDMRAPPNDSPSIEWHWAKNYEEAISLLSKNSYDRISLDHDLGSEAYTGRHILRQIEYYNWWPKQICVHSMNPPGRQSMLSFIAKFAPTGVEILSQC